MKGKDSGLYRAYFIGGEWDGVIKRVDSREPVIEIMKEKRIHDKHKRFYVTTKTREVYFSMDVYEEILNFEDGVLIYKFLKTIDRNNNENL